MNRNQHVSALLHKTPGTRNRRRRTLVRARSRAAGWLAAGLTVVFLAAALAGLVARIAAQTPSMP